MIDPYLRNISPIRGYTQLYHFLKRHLRKEDSWNNISFIFIMVLFFGRCTGDFSFFAAFIYY